MKQDPIQLNLSTEQIIQKMTGQQYHVFTPSGFTKYISKEEALALIASGNVVGIAQQADILSPLVPIAHSKVPQMFEHSMATNFLLRELRMVQHCLKTEEDQELIEDTIYDLVDELHSLVGEQEELLQLATLNFLLHIMRKLKDAASGTSVELLEELCDTAIKYLEVFYEGSRSVWEWS
jgi:hypothetical protein